MSKIEKAKERILSKPKDYTYSEAKSLVMQFGYVEYNKGKTSGSRVKFYREADKAMIQLHKPHPNEILKPYQVEDIVQCLREHGDL